MSVSALNELDAAFGLACSTRLWSLVHQCDEVLPALCDVALKLDEIPAGATPVAVAVVTMSAARALQARSS